MAGCVLFVDGRKFNVDSFLKSSKLRHRASVWHKGDKSNSRTRQRQSDSGFMIEVSKHDDPFGMQTKKAYSFLKKHEEEFKKLRRHRGVERIELRFGIYLYEDSMAVIADFPSKLVSLAGKYSIEICVCVYKTSKE